MRKIKHQYLSPPTFDNPKTTRAARWLHYSLLVLIVVLIVMTMQLPFSSTDPTLKREFYLSQLTLLIVLSLFLVLMRKGLVWPVAYLTVIVSLLAASYTHLITYGTINDLSVIGYFVLIPLVGLLFGRRSMWIAVAISASMLIAGFYLEINGIIEQFERPIATSGDLVFLLTCLGLNTALTLALLTEAEESAEYAEKAATDLASANHDLQISQKSLQRATDELELRVIERTDKLNTANQQLTEEITERIRVEETLRDAKEEAEASTRAKSAFLANMSHEIRTPMNGVIGMAGILIETDLTEAQKEYIQVIRHSSDTLLAVINDILDFSRIESGKWQLAHQPYDVRTCVTDAVEIVASRAAEKHLELAYFIDHDVPTMLIGDGTRVRQILINLVSNAISFTEEGDVFISVTAHRNTDERYTVQFDVRDTGIGIRMEDHQFLFESFSQVDVSSTRRHGGTGLGLAISHGLVKLMEGRLWVTSEVDVGSTFHFSICGDTVDDDNPVEASNDTLASRRVLLLGEYETTRQVLSYYLAHWGVDTLEVQTLDEACHQVATEGAIDLAVLDLRRESDAIIDAIDMLRAKSPNLPIIVCISLNENILRNYLTNYAFLTITHKPIRPSVIFNALQSYFDTANTAQANDSSVPSNIYPPDEAEPIDILLVEDNLVNQRVTAYMLGHLGMSCDLAVNGLEAVEAIRAKPFDIVFMDVQMPELDGIEATRMVRQDQSLNHRQPFIIALTAAAMPEERAQCLAAGMNDFIAKPVRLEGLEKVMARYLKRRDNQLL